MTAGLSSEANRKKEISILNPFTDEEIEAVENFCARRIKEAIKAAESGAAHAKELSRAQRAEILLAAAAIVKKDAEAFAQLITAESGKVIWQARKEVARAVNTLTLSGEEAKRIAGCEIPFDSFPGNEAWRGFYSREPIGPILGITPFNDPLNLVAHKVGPAIAAGNSIIIKPSELAPLSAKKLYNVFMDAGAP